MIITNSSGSRLDHELAALLESSRDIVALVGYGTRAGAEVLDLERIGATRRVRLLLGMACSEGLDTQSRNCFLLTAPLWAANGGGIGATHVPVHSKFWCGEDSAGPWAVLGSSNLSPQGLRDRREANLVVRDARIVGALRLEFDNLWTERIRIHDVVAVERPAPAVIPAGAVASPAATDGSRKVYVSLLNGSGEVHDGDGLNWWRDAATGEVRRGRPDEACIPIRRTNIEALEEVVGSLEPDTVWRACTSTGAKFALKLQGDGAGGRAKQIASGGDQLAFGRWILRDILGLPSGTTVTRQVLLDRLGTTDIVIEPLGRGTDGILEVHLGFEART